MTIYFADEVPLSANLSKNLSDSAPLLDDCPKNSVDISKSTHGMQVDASANGNNPGSNYEQDISLRQVNSTIEGQNGDFNDGPGAVIVNFLTSLRHLPPAMHPVLIVMAFSWVSA